MYTAKSIAAQLKQGTKGEDIALLLRNMTGAPSLTAALDQMGVPYSINCRKGFFECPEVLLLRCLLESIHNPTKDIYLAGALKSPVFGFTLDDLYRVKKGREKEPLRGLAGLCREDRRRKSRQSSAVPFRDAQNGQGSPGR